MADHDADPFDRARERFNAGLAALQAGDAAQAEQALRQSLALLPGRPSTQLNLAVALLRQDRAAEALPLLDAVLADAPDDVDALGHRGAALNRLQQPEQAAPVFQRLVQLAPQRPEAWFHLAQTLQMLGHAEPALAAYERCLALRPDHAAACSQRGTALRELGRVDEAAAAFERALALGDDDGGLNAYYLAALRGGAAPPRSPPAYVQGLFDDYAGDFERHLVDELDYHAPAALQRALLGLGRSDFAEGLDLGCGTGLCAPLLRPLAGRLQGVDLSAAMLRAAAARGLYDELHQADVVQHLQALAAAGRQADLLVAADVLIYLGDLAPLFAAAARVLAPGGVLAFSVEIAAPEQPFVLQPSLRYAHGEAALRRLAAAHGLQPRHEERGLLRVEQAQPVVGQYWVLQRGAPA
ncbi:MAG: tetratricopeptide repeat protein [Proteobacteria bacterium]|nr:tetratricopeptide repeat protein [Pseudomonadota bacterium]